MEIHAVACGLTRALPTGPLGRLLAAWLLIGTGGWAFMIALAVYAFDRSGVGSVAAATAARLVPAMLAAPVAGNVVDRGNRARVVTVACVLQAASFAGAAILIESDAPLGTVLGFAAISGIVGTAARPALAALMPALARTPAELTRATALWSATDSGAFLLGSGVGGLAIAATGPVAIVAVGVVAVGLAAVCAAGLPTVLASAADEPGVAEPALRAALAGLRALVDARDLRVPFGLFAILLLLQGMSDVQLVGLAIGPLGMGSGGPGELYAIWGVGGLIGSGLMLRVVRRRGYGLALAAGVVAFGAALAVAGADGTGLALTAMIPVGIGFSLVETAVMALVARLADDAVIGRVYALSELLYTGVAGIGAIVAAPLIDAVGLGASLGLVGGAFAVAGILSWGVSARLDAGQEDAGIVRDLLRRLPFLGPLPLPRLERLVRQARPIAFPAGATIISAGEHGEDFFVIEDGIVDVVEFARQMGPGEGFGEIALLRDIPRTATVRAQTDVRVRALARPVFISAVTQHEDAGREAHAVVETHLARPRRL
ncbi:MAG TPA: cyclic nucleotide-binding domain-containing protein [Solirubrobacteraceae bacterium]|jgi:MFS family permease|nr:cyclic nucleotide-binding domain-containing protein [Solirubrobacteraceae bacterium]